MNLRLETTQELGKGCREGRLGVQVKLHPIPVFQGGD